MQCSNLESEVNRDIKVATFAEVEKVRNSRKQHETSGCEEAESMSHSPQYGAATTY
jgi:hypothetical protein